MTKKDGRGSHLTPERARELRKMQKVHPRTLHRLNELVLNSRRACLPTGCVKAHVCPCARRPEGEQPDHCLALEAHLTAYGRTLRRVVQGPIDAHLLGIILRREELLTLGAWFLSEKSPFYEEEGRPAAAAVLTTYQALLSAQARDLLALRARGMSRPDPSEAFAKALEQLPDATPPREAAPGSTNAQEDDPS